VSVALPQFRFSFIEVPLRKSPRIRRSVRCLGAKAVQYATALESLATAGNLEAGIALRLLNDEARRIHRAGLRPKFDAKHWNHVAPVNLDPIKRWQMDEAGVLALELLLWLWQAHLNPSAYPVVGGSAAESKPFTVNSVRRWWHLARIYFLHFYPKPEQVPELIRLVTAPSVKGSAAKERQDILGKIRDHFTRFAPYPG